MTIQQTQQKTALVTGAARGIGAAVAVRLARDSFNIVVNYAVQKDAADALVREIEAAGGRALSIQADVSDTTAFPRIFDAAEKAFGGVDVLVNNAAIAKPALIADADDALFDRHVAVNFKGTFNGMREAARRLRDGGRIINLSTSLVGIRMEAWGVYAGTKAAVETMTAVLSKELRGRNITVNCIAPGPTATDGFMDGKSPEMVDRMAKLSPLERLGTPEDIAAAIAFLAGPDGGWINGQRLRANGGAI